MRVDGHLPGGLLAHEADDAQNDEDHDDYAYDRRQHDECDLERLLVGVANEADLLRLHIKDAIVLPHKAIAQDPKISAAQAHHGQCAA